MGIDTRPVQRWEILEAAGITIREEGKGLVVEMTVDSAARLVQSLRGVKTVDTESVWRSTSWKSSHMWVSEHGGHYRLVNNRISRYDGRRLTADSRVARINVSVWAVSFEVDPEIRSRCLD